MTISRQRFDEYVLKARVYPAVLAVAPVLSVTVWIPLAAWVGSLVPTLGGLAFTFLVAELVRGLGKSTERRLYRVWNGAPTTRALRYRSGTDTALRPRRRAVVETVTGLPLPDEQREMEDPVAADEEIVATVFVAIARLRELDGNASLLQAENMAYGFRRNLRALKVIALSTCVASIGSTLAAAVLLPGSIYIYVVLAAVVLYGALIARMITDDWVKEQAVVYTNRLFAALESATAPRKTRKKR